MKTLVACSVALVLMLAALPVRAQQTDYLTPDEINLVRDTQEPNKRIQLFLRFATERLAKFEASLAGKPGEEPASRDELDDQLNDFINAVDDTSSALQVPLERGGADLHKTRPQLEEALADFTKRLQAVHKLYESEDIALRYDLEDALEATHDLAEMAKKIPEGRIPPAQPEAVPGEQETPAANRPSLKHREEKEKPPPPPGPTTLLID